LILSICRDQKQNKTLEAKIQEALQAQDTRPNFTIIEHFNTDNNTSLTEPSLSSSLNTTQSLTVTTTNTIINSNNNKYESNDKNQKRIESKRGVVTVKDEDIASLSHQPEVTFQFSQPSNSLSPTTTTTTATTSSSSSSSTSTIRSRDTLTNSETRLVEVTSQSENSESMSDTESGSDIDPNGSNSIPISLFFFLSFIISLTFSMRIQLFFCFSTLLWIYFNRIILFISSSFKETH
jgi:cobalamin biosynthesis Mg chelatase CobN